jgi:hypothetical protein
MAAMSAKSPAVFASLALTCMGLLLVSALISGRISIGVFLPSELPPWQVAMTCSNRKSPQSETRLLSSILLFIDF